MAFKKEPCRNFQRGSCHYGERCKFLHVNQQQSKQNGFGFGVQNGFQQTNSQQQKPNPFGFGVQNSSQPKMAFDTGSKQNQFKPFGNKWTRASITPGNSPSMRKPESQPHAADHKCTDPDSCKRQIVQDFEHERPLWKLTCYGHSKSAPCDIVGDVSYEELRAAAYIDAKSGLSLQTIVDRERSLVNSKLTEFESFLHKPYSAPSGSTLATPNPHLGTSPIASLAAPGNYSPSVSSFSQPGSSANVWPEMRTSAPSNYIFGQSNAVQNSSWNAQGPFGGPLPNQTAGIPFPTNSATFSNSFINSGNNSLTPSVLSQPIPESTKNLSTMFPGVSGPPSDVGQAAMNAPLLEKQNITGDASIWMKEEWNIGEIPEEAPPDTFV